MPDLSSRLQGAMYGLLIGDALGVPYEFSYPEQIPPPGLIEFTPPADFRRAHAGVEPGTWSDDGAQALILLHSLLECGRFDEKFFAHGLINWYEHGFMAVDYRVFDVGMQTAVAVGQLRQAVDPLQVGGRGERDNGNGSLMRVLPLALWHKGSDADLIKDAFDQSSLTHGHLRSQLCCALYCLWARQILLGDDEKAAWHAAVAKLRAHFSSGPIRDEFEDHVAPDSEYQATGSGYVVDCLFSARDALQAADYEAVVRRAIQFGNDTDTTACVAGGLAGLRGGLEDIPQRWRAALRGQEIAAPLVERLCAYWNV